MKNNKGFSLVELIIVIAIMAILVGVMAPQLIKYIDKTNESADTQLCDSVRTALITAASDPDSIKLNETLTNGNFTDPTGAMAGTSAIVSCYEEIMGLTAGTEHNKLKSKKGKAANAVNVSVNDNTICVWVVSGTIEAFPGN